MTPLPPVALSTTITPPLPVEVLADGAFKALIDVVLPPVASVAAQPSLETAALKPPTATVKTPEAIAPEQRARAMLALFGLAPEDDKKPATEKPTAEISDHEISGNEISVDEIAGDEIFAAETAVDRSAVTAQESLTAQTLPTAALAVPPSAAAPNPPARTANTKRNAAEVPLALTLPLPTTVPAAKQRRDTIAAPSRAAPPPTAAPDLATPTVNDKRGAGAVPIAIAIARPTASEQSESPTAAVDVLKTPSPSFVPFPVLAPVAPGSPALVTDVAATAAPSFTDRQLELASDTQWLDQLATDIVAAARSDQRLSFRLIPPNLGTLDVDLATSDGGMSVRMATQSQDAHTIIAAAQPQLVSELRAQGIRITETDVHMSDPGQRGQPGQHGQNPANQPQHVPVEVSMSTTDSGDARDQELPTGRFA